MVFLPCGRVRKSAGWPTFDGATRVALGSVYVARVWPAMNPAKLLYRRLGDPV